MNDLQIASLLATYTDAFLNGKDVRSIEDTMRALKIPIPSNVTWTMWRNLEEQKWNLMAKQDPPRYPPGDPPSDNDYDQWQHGD